VGGRQEERKEIIKKGNYEKEKNRQEKGGKVIGYSGWLDLEAFEFVPQLSHLKNTFRLCYISQSVLVLTSLEQKKKYIPTLYIF